MVLRHSQRLLNLKVAAAPQALPRVISSPTTTLPAASSSSSTNSASEEPVWPPIFENYCAETFAANLDPYDLDPLSEDLNWALPIPLLIMPPDILQIDLLWTLIINSRAFHRLVTYDPEDHCLTAYAYPGTFIPSEHCIQYLPYECLVDFFAKAATKGLKTPSCICGPLSGQWEVYTPTILQKMSMTCQQVENHGELAFFCAKGNNGCRWWQPVVHLFANNQGPTDVQPCLEEDEFVGFRTKDLHEFAAASPPPWSLTNLDGSLPSLPSLTESTISPLHSVRSIGSDTAQSPLVRALDVAFAVNSKHPASSPLLSGISKKFRASGALEKGRTPNDSSPMYKKMVSSKKKYQLRPASFPVDLASPSLNFEGGTPGKRTPGDSILDVSATVSDDHFFNLDQDKTSSENWAKKSYRLTAPCPCSKGEGPSNESPTPVSPMPNADVIELTDESSDENERVPTPRLKSPSQEVIEIMDGSSEGDLDDVEVDELDDVESPTVANQTSTEVIEISDNSESDNEKQEEANWFQRHSKIPEATLERNKDALLSPEGITLELLLKNLTRCTYCKAYYLVIHCSGGHQCSVKNSIQRRNSPFLGSGLGITVILDLGVNLSQFTRKFFFEVFAPLDKPGLPGILELPELDLVVLVHDGEDWDSLFMPKLVLMYENGMSVTELVKSRVEGYHVYYHYQDAVIKVAETSGSRLYSKIFALPLAVSGFSPVALASISISAMPTSATTSTLSSTVIPTAPSGYQALPLEILEEVCLLCDPQTRLSLRVVDRSSRIVASRHTHRRLKLSLPPNWQSKKTPSPSKFSVACFDEELVMAIFIWMWFVGQRAVSFSLTNYSMMNNTAFFMRLLPRLETLIIQGVQCLAVNNPRIHFPYICPHHIQHLVLRNVIFVDVGVSAHAVESLMAPGMELRTVEINNVIHGHTPVSIPNPSPLLVSRWRERWGLSPAWGPSPTSLKLFRMVLLAPNFQKLSNTGPRPNGRPPLENFQCLVRQLFRLPHGHMELAPYLEDNEIYPCSFPTTHLTQLDLGLTEEVLSLGRPILRQVANTLLYLRLRLCTSSVLHVRMYIVLTNLLAASQTFLPIDWDSPTEYISMRDLQVLQEFVLITPLSNLSYGLKTAQSWWSQSKFQSWTSFELIIKLPPNDARPSWGYRATQFLRDYLSAGDVKIILQGCDLHIHAGAMYRGRFLIHLWAGRDGAGQLRVVRQEDVEYVTNLVASLKEDPLIHTNQIEWKV
ncbi:uncharacterized protein EV420DRAFT_1475776 [Desarmillaria tabescens]|uniref:F-box domain-containing protein n=1 Tax=Armillaria tabescens TaxID=1929756 RepID=A0AA39NEP6_ARMTA|nr:uncharacterized protein EV420DRAFT_1475776 [Desarmillaria tabescens]KAK0464268.1 hypothetical protein EV420DRAFT_1475776 [Desarmillaria tabescens]